MLNILYRTDGRSVFFFFNYKSKTWQASLPLIPEFDTVEDFWALHNHNQLSGNLMPGCDYALFRVVLSLCGKMQKTKEEDDG